MKFLIFIGTNVGGALGWSAGEPFGMLAAFIASGVGSAIGVYAGLVGGAALAGVTQDRHATVTSKQMTPGRNRVYSFAI